MTHLISLSMKGFKSFGKHITVKFSENMTGVVGPNGSGKSNVADAVCFVLGRASMKTMRAKKGSDLIFNGAKKWKPSPYAEVKLVLDNKKAEFGADHGETVTVSRRVHPDGLNSYRINGQRCTKNQMMDLLAMQKIFPNGHNIVLQGDIGALVKMSLEERRRIIDEIAGIEEYEEKKHKSLLEFDAVQRRIAEVDLLMREKQRQLDRLKREKEQAERYQKLENIKRLVEASISKRKHDDKVKEKERLLKETGELEEKIVSSDKRSGELEVELSGMKKEMHSLEKSLSASQSDETMRKAAEAERLSMMLNSSRQELENLDEAGKKAASEKDRLVRRIAELEKVVSNLKEKIGVREKEHAKEREDLEKLEGRRESLMEAVRSEGEARGEVEKNLKSVEEEIEEARSRKSSIELEIERAKNNQERMSYAANELRQRIGKIEERSRTVHGEQKELEEKIKQLSEEKEGVKRELEELSSGIKEIEFSLEEAREKTGRLESEIRASKAGNPAANELISLNTGGIVAKLKDVVKEGNPAAVFAALDDPNALLVESFDRAKEIARIVQEKKLGRVTLIPLNARAGEAPMAHLVQVEEKFRSAVLSALGKTKVCESLEQAFGLGDGVTEDGTLVRGGKIVAGEVLFDSRLEAGLKKEKEALDKLKERMSFLTSQFEGKRKNDYSLFLELQKLEIKLKALLSFEPAEADKLKAELKSAEASAESHLKLREAKEKGLEEVSGQLKVLWEKRQALLEKDRPTLAIEGLSSIDKELTQLRKREQELRAELLNMKSQLENSVLVELNNGRKTVPLLEKEQEELKVRMGQVGANCSRLEEELAKTRAEVEEISKDLTGLAKRKKELEEKRVKLEEEKYRIIGNVTAFRKEIKMISESLGEIERDLAELARGFAQGQSFMEGSVNKLTERLHKIEARLQRIGAVNLMAIDQFGSFEDEFREIDGKKQMLEKEKGSILEFMNEVEKRKKEAFMGNFSGIAKSFEIVYAKLTGGEGKLLLENPETIFDGGLIIQASPKGKEISRIDSMSGGEKTMTALAFLSAIQEHRPAPFYIYDEVDAALDKQNSDMLAKVFREYSRKSQFIVVTHNDAVMRECDQIVGVHLSDGISRIVSAEQKYLAKTP